MGAAAIARNRDDVQSARAPGQMPPAPSGQACWRGPGHRKFHGEQILSFILPERHNKTLDEKSLPRRRVPVVKGKEALSLTLHSLVHLGGTSRGQE